MDSTKLSRLAGSVPNAVAAAHIGARVESSIPLTHITLLLAPTDDQEVALRSLIDVQQDKSSPYFHKWLTPETFGQQFGASSADIAAITGWLQNQGLSIESVARNGRMISFAGTVGQVETAFSTQLNHIVVDGEDHISNVTEVAIPTALASVVQGIVSLNDFRPRANNTGSRKATIPAPTANSAISSGFAPMYTSVSSGSHYVAPGDAAVIFNSAPLLNAGINGTGQTIAVLGRSNINLSDVQQFRSMFGLGKKDPVITVLGNDPGLNGDADEAYLDVEWAGGMAPNANVNFIVAGPDYYVSSGINGAGLYAVDNNIGDIVSLSYGGCETSNLATSTAFWNTLWQQAASQGQTVFVSTGDSNATGCSSSSSTYGTAYGVNALGSSAYNVAVGGSMFVDYGPSAYWAAGQSAPAPTGYTFSTAQSYIPEAAWNEGALTTTLLNSTATATSTGVGISGGGGGISIFTARPSWQTGSGIPTSADITCSSGTCMAAATSGSLSTGLHRLVPDIVSIAASGHDATIFCGEGVCSDTSTGYGIGAIGGTSVATPVMASVQALINQKNGGRQGNANFFYYPLAAADYAAGNCKATNGTAGSPTVTLPASTCNFHDVVAGDNRSKQNASDTTGLGFYAGTGFDGSTGLGSLNITNVANNWSTVSFRATITTFTLSPAAGITHGSLVNFAAQVAPSSGTGTPTGDISIIVEGGSTPGSTMRYTLSAGAYSAAIKTLPAGNYKVHVHYAGDTTFAASDSASLPVSIAQEASTTTNTLRYLTSAGSIYSGATTIPYGAETWINTKITPATSTATNVPTGTVVYSVALNGSVIGSTTQTLDGYGGTSFQSGGGYASIYLQPNFPALTPGSYVITTSYSGDSTYLASTTTSSFTVSKGVPAITGTASSSYITSGASVTFTTNVTRPYTTTSATGFFSASAQPTGTVTFLDNTTGTTLGTVSLNSSQIAALATTAITTSGTHTVSMTYSGDANYAATSVTSPGVTVSGTLTSTTTTAAYTPGTYYVGSTVPITATVSPAAAGTVTFFDNGNRIGSANSSASTGLATLSTSVLGTAYTGYNGFTAGAHTITATFGGTATYATSTGSTTVSISPNPATLTVNAPTTSVYGQTIQLNGRLVRSPAPVNPLVVPSGTVSFYDGSTLVGSTSNLVYQSGYLYYSSLVNNVSLTAGTHSITAQYTADSNFTAATSAAVIIVVSKYSPAVSISAPLSVYNTGSSVPLSITMPLSSALASPTDVFSVYDNGTLLGTATPAYSSAASAWTATYTISSLTFGVHSYTVSYGVSATDTNYALASSTPAFSLTGVSNNVWVGNANGTVSALNNSGTAMVTAVSGGGAAIAIDGSGNTWSVRPGANSVSAFTKVGTTVSGSPFTAGGINAPTAVAVDGEGKIWIANGNNSVSVLQSTGAAVSSTPLTGGGLSGPTAMAIDTSGSVWITNGTGDSVTQIIGGAAPVSTPATAVSNATVGVKP